MAKKPGKPTVDRRVPLAALTYDAGNDKKHTEKSKAVVRASLERFGQVEPLIVRAGSGVVVGGNSRLEIMRDLGWTHADVREVDITDDEARALYPGLFARKRRWLSR